MEQCTSQEWLLCLWGQCFHVQSNCLGKHLPQCFHESALKVHMIHCDSLATLAPVLVVHEAQSGVQCAMNGCEFGLMAFV